MIRGRSQRCMSAKCSPKVEDRRKRRETVMQTITSGDDVVVVFISLSSLDLNIVGSIGCDANTRSNVQTSRD
jgi:hypothetical protein